MTLFHPVSVQVLLDPVLLPGALNHPGSILSVLLVSAQYQRNHCTPYIYSPLLAFSAVLLPVLHNFS